MKLVLVSSDIKEDDSVAEEKEEIEICCGFDRAGPFAADRRGRTGDF